MRIVLIATGTRGDVQPMIALGKGLVQAGHQIKLISGSNFTSWVESYGLEVFPTIDMEALMQSDLGIKWVESTSQLDQLKHMKALMNSVAETAIADMLKGTQDAELMIGGFVSEPFLQTISEKCDIPLISLALQPYRTTRSGAASLVPILPRSNSILNAMMGRFAERFTWSISADSTNLLRTRFGLPPHTARSYNRIARLIPSLYAIDPHVVPPVDDTNAVTTGYLFLDEAYTPPADLIRFLEAGDAPVYVGFGSMSSSDPMRTIHLIAEALAKVGRRGVLARGWSGADHITVPDHIYLLDKTSHTWLFPHMAAVVHHGGAGTTAAGLRAGKPTLIVPHMADQPYWGRRIHELGVGVKPIPRHQLTLDTLTKRLKTLLTDSDIQTRAVALGDQIRADDGVANAVNWIQAFISRLH